MKLKLDENFGGRCIDILSEASHEVATVASQHMSGATDQVVIQVCRSESRCLVYKFSLGVLTRQLVNSRCSTPFGIMGILTADIAEASRSAHRAQHLSASWEFSHRAFHNLGSLDKVLNAFRHHGNSHVDNLVARSARNAVLNAFRHHGNSHVRLRVGNSIP